MLKFITHNRFLHIEDVPFKQLSCPVCEFSLRDADDQKSLDEKGACTDCIDRFYYPNLDKWSEGWRPTIKEARSPGSAIFRKKSGDKNGKYSKREVT